MEAFNEADILRPSSRLITFLVGLHSRGAVNELNREDDFSPVNQKEGGFPRGFAFSGPHYPKVEGCSFTHFLAMLLKFVESPSHEPPEEQPVCPFHLGVASWVSDRGKA